MCSTVILDMEWTQNGKEIPVNSRGDVLHSEIIQIGAVKLNEQTGEREEEFSIDIFPMAQGKVNARIEKLTGIRTGELKKTGRRFKSAFAKFQEFLGNEAIRIGTWDDTDRVVLEENMRYWKVSFACEPQYYDIQIICGQYLFPGQPRKSVKNALRQLEMKPVGRLHTALADAVNESRIFFGIPDCMSTFTTYDPFYFAENVPNSPGLVVHRDLSLQEGADLLKETWICSLTEEEAGEKICSRFFHGNGYYTLWKDSKNIYRMERARFSKDKKTLYAYYRIVSQERAERILRWKEQYRKRQKTVEEIQKYVQ